MKTLITLTLILLLGSAVAGAAPASVTQYNPNRATVVSVVHDQDDSGFTSYNTPNGERISVPVYRLVGENFNDNTLDANFWTAAIGTGGTVAPTNGEVTLSTGTTANNAVSLQSAQNGRFIAGAPHKVNIALRLGDTGTVNNTRRWGAFTSGPTDGAYFQLSGTTLSLVTCNTGSCVSVSNGSFNGDAGSTVTLDTNTHTYEIVFTHDMVYFYIDETLVDTQTFSTTPWTSTMNLPIRLENTNSGGSTTNVSMYTVEAVLVRLGLPHTQPVSYFQSGTTAGVTLKLGAGTLHGCIISNVTVNSVVTLYDSRTATGTVLWSSGAMGAQTIPFDLDFKNVEFSNGLTETITGAAANVLCMYE